MVRPHIALGVPASRRRTALPAPGHGAERSGRAYGGPGLRTVNSNDPAPDGRVIHSGAGSEATSHRGSHAPPAQGKLQSCNYGFAIAKVEVGGKLHRQPSCLRARPAPCVGGRRAHLSPPRSSHEASLRAGVSRPSGRGGALCAVLPICVGLSMAAARRRRPSLLHDESEPRARRGDPRPFSSSTARRGRSAPGTGTRDGHTSSEPEPATRTAGIDGAGFGNPRRHADRQRSRRAPTASPSTAPWSSWREPPRRSPRCRSPMPDQLGGLL